MCIALDLVGLGSVILVRVAGNLFVLVVFESFGESFRCLNRNLERGEKKKGRSIGKRVQPKSVSHLYRC